MNEATSSDGECGRRSYDGITQAKVDAIIRALRENGATVSGNNPWDVDTKNHGVKLRGTWSAADERLSLIVTGKNFYVPCGRIWREIDELMEELQQLDESALPA